MKKLIVCDNGTSKKNKKMTKKIPNYLKNKKCIDCGKQLWNLYAKRCTSCANKVTGIIRAKHRKSFVGKNNPNYGNHILKGIKRPQFSKQILGKNNPAYIDGKTLKKYYCIICHKKLGITAYQGTKLCRKCSNKKRIIWNKGKKIGNKICRHHLDLNKKNNKKTNILNLTNSLHLSFHRLIYRYILEKFGIKEILKYKQWFFKYHAK